MLGRFAIFGVYDRDLDRFLQYLRVTVGQGTLVGLLESLCGDQAQARGMAERLGDLQGVRAHEMGDDTKQRLRNFMLSMKMGHAYNSAQDSIATSSSGKSSEDGEEEVEMPF